MVCFMIFSTDLLGSIRIYSPRIYVCYKNTLFVLFGKGSTNYVEFFLLTFLKACIKISDTFFKKLVLIIRVFPQKN